MSRKRFIMSHGATCRNWAWSWSFINERERFVIFGAWKHHTHDGCTLILGDAWGRRRTDGARNAGFAQSREHIRRVEEDGFRLFTYPIIAVEDPDAAATPGPAQIERSEFELTERSLRRQRDGWYAYPLPGAGGDPPIAGRTSACWLFQGNPVQFRINDYLAQCPQFVYWRTSRYAREIRRDDTAMIWRAGRQAALVAIGRVTEAPTPASAVAHPESVGHDFALSGQIDPQELLTGISIDAVRLGASEGCIARPVLASNPVLRTCQIITMPRATVFRLNEAESSELRRLWAASAEAGDLGAGSETHEGQRRLVSHWRRERSDWIRARKLETCAGRYSCEVCGLEQPGGYPEKFATRIFEVHHLVPLARAADRVQTRLEDLAILCANCHRAVHVNEHVEENLEQLKRAWKSSRDAPPPFGARQSSRRA